MRCQLWSTIYSAMTNQFHLNFLWNSTYLRTSIDEYLTANGISAETTLEVEYVARALIPPLHIASFLHDDWVSSVDALSATSVTGGQSVAAGQEKILSGSYDGLCECGTCPLRPLLFRRMLLRGDIRLQSKQ